MKQVTDPLDDKVKARIVGRDRSEPVYFSSGSEQSGDNDDDGSPRLSDLLDSFLEDDAGAQSPVNESGSAHEPDFNIEDFAKTTLLNAKSDRYRNALLAHVSKAIEVFTYLNSNRSLLRRNVMAFLRKFGYNAAICKSKWESSGGLIAGKHEFIDVVRSESSVRYFIELDFTGEFEIVRPTNQYERLLETLPRVFIGKNEDLKEIVKVMSDAAKRSLKSRGLHLPPWRKNRYMQNKWFGPYRRTVNLVPENTSSLFMPIKPKLIKVECRSVGFDAVNGRSHFTAGISQIK